MNDGEVGYFCYLRLINTAINADNVENFKSILPPASDGFKACVSQILEVPEAGAYLTKNCKDPVAALKWIDAQLETETMMVSLNGRVGEQIVLNDEGKYEVIDIPADNGLYHLCRSPWVSSLPPAITTLPFIRWRPTAWNAMKTASGMPKPACWNRRASSICAT